MAKEDRMRLVDLNILAAGPTVRITGRFERERGGALLEPYVEYDVDAEFIGNAPDVFAAAMLLPAMRVGEALRIGAPVSPRLAIMLPRIRDIFHTWWPHLSRIDIDVTPAVASAAPASNRSATFFSGGVDSFYTFLKHHGGHGTLQVPMAHVIFMRGVETRLQHLTGVDETEQSVREIAARMGANVIVGETNFRTVLQGPEEHLHWERHYHGSALAAIALGLSQGLGFACIPSAFSYNHLVAHGSTPLVDEMFSTERLQVLHDGAEATRPMKVARIIQWDRDLVLQHLRVCLENRGGASNCGRCRKCVRTAVPLRVLGVWNDAVLFKDKRTDHWERVMMQDHLVLTDENLRFAQEHGGDAELISMLRRVIRRKRRRESLKRLLARSPFDRLRPALRRTREYWSSPTQ
jgi:hypothetical protein